MNDAPRPIDLDLTAMIHNPGYLTRAAAEHVQHAQELLAEYPGTNCRTAAAHAEIAQALVALAAYEDDRLLVNPAEPLWPDDLVRRESEHLGMQPVDPADLIADVDDSVVRSTVKRFGTTACQFCAAMPGYFHAIDCPTVLPDAPRDTFDEADAFHVYGTSVYADRVEHTVDGVQVSTTVEGESSCAWCGHAAHPDGNCDAPSTIAGAPCSCARHLVRGDGPEIVTTGVPPGAVPWSVEYPADLIVDEAHHAVQTGPVEGNAPGLLGPVDQLTRANVTARTDGSDWQGPTPGREAAHRQAIADLPIDPHAGWGGAAISGTEAEQRRARWYPLLERIVAAETVDDAIACVFPYRNRRPEVLADLDLALAEAHERDVIADPETYSDRPQMLRRAVRRYLQRETS